MEANALTSQLNPPGSSRPHPRAGVIGLGAIGGGVAVSLARRGRIPAVFDVRPEAADGLEGVPAALESVGAVAEQSDVVLIAVVDANQLRDVLTGPHGLLGEARAGLIVVVLSTVSVPVIEELAAQCAEVGVALLDCGVTPGDKAADNGMVAMVGGPEDVVQRAMPVLMDFAKGVAHCGPLGAGMATKIARNVVTYVTWAVVAEASELVRSSGVALQRFLEVLQMADADGGLQLRMLTVHAAGIEVPSDTAATAAALAAKDLAAALELGADTGVPVPLASAAQPSMRAVFSGESQPNR